MDLNVARQVDKWLGLALCLVFFAFDRTVGRLLGRRMPPLVATTPPQPDAPVPTPRRILCIKFYGLGNIVMLIPVLEALRRRHPGAEIDFLTMTGNVELLGRSGVITRAIGVDTSTIGRFVRTISAALRVVRSRGYDTVVDFEQFVKVSTVIAYLSGARERIGFNTDGQRRGFAYTTRVVYTDSEHMRDIYARLTRPLDVTGPLPAVRLALSAEERAKAAAFLAAAGVSDAHFPIVAMHLGIGMNFYEVPLKRWDPSYFATLADTLSERYGAVVVFTGQGADEAELIATTRARMRHPALDASNRFSIGELAALLERCHFVVSNDTSVMHVASLMGTPVVALFGPTAPAHYGPQGTRDLVFYRDLYCSPCLTNYNLKVSRCVDPVCMRTITPEMVLAAIEAQYLGDTAAHRDWLQGRVRAASAA
jgi:ADP-heptose:LPS heptosyltransferase